MMLPRHFCVFAPAQLGDPYGEYNALLRRLTRFVRALEHPPSGCKRIVSA